MVTSCDFGTGCTLDSSGSLVMLHTACVHYTETGASPVACDEWDTAIEIPSIKALQSNFAATVYTPFLDALHFSLVLIGIYISMRFVFRIITHYRPRFRFRR